MTYSDEVVAEAHALRLTGMTARAIGARFGAPKTTVEGWLSKRNRHDPVPRRFNTDAPHCVHGDEVVASARALRKEGTTVRAISERLGVSISTVESWIYGLTRPIKE